VWIVTLALDCSAPMHGFWLPGIGWTPTRDRTLAGVHLAERNQLVVLIALGESIVDAGAAYRELHASAAVVTAFVVGFAETVSFWWVYFVR
jgi:low temperature requirement protein LtrA